VREPGDAYNDWRVALNRSPIPFHVRPFGRELDVSDFSVVQNIDTEFWQARLRLKPDNSS